MMTIHQQRIRKVRLRGLPAAGRLDAILSARLPLATMGGATRPGARRLRACWPISVTRARGNWIHQDVWNEF